MLTLNAIIIPALINYIYIYIYIVILDCKSKVPIHTTLFIKWHVYISEEITAKDFFPTRLPLLEEPRLDSSHQSSHSAKTISSTSNSEFINKAHNIMLGEVVSLPTLHKAGSRRRTPSLHTLDDSRKLSLSLSLLRNNIGIIYSTCMNDILAITTLMARLVT